MTEADWLEATEPSEMLSHVDADAGWPQAYHFSAACLRRIWHLLPGHHSRSVVVALERWASGERGFAMDEVRKLAETEARNVGWRPSAYAGYAASEWSPHQVAENAAEAAAVAGDTSIEAEALAQSDLLRDIFGNPFRSVAFAPEWRTDTAVTLARQMYDAREFSAMPILVDALQDAGCDSDDILNHCRDASQVHVRGCWVVDLVLGKA